MKTGIILSLLSFLVWPALSFADRGGISGGGGSAPGAGHTAHPQMIAVRISNEVGLKLMHATIIDSLGKGQSKNTMISPLSVSLALSMALNGTAHQTRKDLLQGLGVTGFDETGAVDLINNSNLDLLKSIGVARASQPRGKYDPVPAVLSINNGAWRTNGQTDGKHFEFAPSFTKNLADSYKANAGVLDFAQPSAVSAVNSWVAEKTEGLIKSIVGKDDLKKLLWLLVNTTYFEGGWENKFNKYQGTTPFHLLNGQVKEVDMISAHSNFAYTENADREAIQLPFNQTNGKQFSLVVVLPRAGVDFNALQSSGELWQPQYWRNLNMVLNNALHEKGIITLPKFTFNSGAELTRGSNLTSAMGLDFLFANTADFSAMATPGSMPSQVNLIRQLTRIELDENGVKAAAVTAIGGGGHASPRPVPPRFNMIVDRPFAFAIIEPATGALLFVGSVVEP
jgi:serine protease inhibitor